MVFKAIKWFVMGEEGRAIVWGIKSLFTSGAHRVLVSGVHGMFWI
jgi:hypothetical protein